MKRSYAISILVVAMVALPRLAAQESRPAGEAESSEYGDTFVLLVTCDPSLLPTGTYLPVKYLLDAGILTDSFAQVMKGSRLSVANVTGVGGLHATGMSGEPSTEVVPGRADSTGPTLLGGAGARNVIMVSVSLAAQNSSSASQWSALADRVRERLEQQLRKMHETEVKRAEELVAQARLDTDRLADRILVLRKLRSDLVSMAQFGDLSRDSVLELARKIQKDRQEITLKADHLTARQGVLQQMVAELAEEAKKKANQDNPVLQAYKLRLEAVERKLEEAKSRHQSGLIPGSELRDAEVQLATAKAELASKTQEIVDASGGKRLPALNDELFKITLELVEAQTHREALEGGIGHLRELMSLADKYETEIGSRLPALEQAYRAAGERLLQLEQHEANMQPPTVTLLGR